VWMQVAQRPSMKKRLASPSRFFSYSKGVPTFERRLERIAVRAQSTVENSASAYIRLQLNPGRTLTSKLVDL
jgi:hypothetical protein